MVLYRGSEIELNEIVRELRHFSVGFTPTLFVDRFAGIDAFRQIWRNDRSIVLVDREKAKSLSNEQLKRFSHYIMPYEHVSIWLPEESLDLLDNLSGPLMSLIVSLLPDCSDGRPRADVVEQIKSELPRPFIVAIIYEGKSEDLVTEIHVFDSVTKMLARKAG